MAQRYCFLLVVFLAAGYQLDSRALAFIVLRQGAEEDGSRHAGAHLVSVARESEQRGAAPEDVCGGGVGVALGSVEDEVADAGARYVEVLGRDVGEDDAGSYFWRRPLPRGVQEVRLAEIWKAEEPEDGVWDAGQDA